MKLNLFLGRGGKKALHVLEWLQQEVKTYNITLTNLFLKFVFIIINSLSVCLSLPENFPCEINVYYSLPVNDGMRGHLESQKIFHKLN